MTEEIKQEIGLKKPPSITFECSIHGKQTLKSMYFAGIVLECGCAWRSTFSGLVYDERVAAS